MKNIILNSTLLLLLTACGEFHSRANHQKIEESNSSTTTKAYFGDKKNNSVIVVDVENMEKVADVPTGHLITYAIDKVIGNKKLYVVNRGSDNMDVMDANSYEITKTIPLKHHPRSAETMNKKLKLCEVSGMDKPMASIIDIITDKVVATVGDDTVTYPITNNHGGSHATGHPFWLDATHFALLDRKNRKIICYQIDKDANGTVSKPLKLNELNLQTSVHQIIPHKGNYFGKENFFYATGEGSDEDYPFIVELELTQNGLEKRREVTLKKEGVEKKEMYLHHGDFHPKEPLIYVGSGDGTLFIVNYKNMTIEKTIPVGKGVGHVVMAKKKHLAIAINHKDKFITIIDTNTNTKIKDVMVSSVDQSLVGKSMIQAHPKYYVSKDGNYFYAFLTVEGKMYELDLNTLEITREVEVGGNPAQGSFISK